MKNEFEKWMVKFDGKEPTTAAQYKSSIGLISRHYSQQKNEIIDIYKLNDILIIKGLVKDYGIGGKYRDIGQNGFGKNGHGTVRNAIATYAKFLEHRKRDNQNEDDYQKHNKTTITFDCFVCHNKFTIATNEDFNAFACKNCRSMFSYEWKNNKLMINVVKKGNIIPDNIKILIKYFNLELPVELEKLKRSYHQLLSQYHPDKVSHLANEFKELSEKKTKEIIQNYELLYNWINCNGVRANGT